MLTKDNFPQDFFIKLENEEFLEGRIILNKLDDRYLIEVDLIQKGSRKIFYHIGLFDNFSDADEAIDQGVQKLSHFLQNADERKV